MCTPDCGGRVFYPVARMARINRPLDVGLNNGWPTSVNPGFATGVIFQAHKTGRKQGLSLSPGCGMTHAQVMLATYRRRESLPSRLANSTPVRGCLLLMPLSTHPAQQCQRAGKEQQRRGYRNRRYPDIIDLQAVLLITACRGCRLQCAVVRNVEVSIVQVSSTGGNHGSNSSGCWVPASA